MRGTGPLNLPPHPRKGRSLRFGIQRAGGTPPRTLEVSLWCFAIAVGTAVLWLQSC